MFVLINIMKILWRLFVLKSLAFIVIFFIGLTFPIQIEALSIRGKPCLVLPEPWLHLKVNFDKNSFPSAIGLQSVNILGESTFSVTNSGKTPLYFYGKDEFDFEIDPQYNGKVWPNSQLPQLPKDTMPRYQIAENDVVYNYSYHKDWDAQWVEEYIPKKFDEPGFIMSTDVMRRFGANITDNVYEFNRPDSFKAPEAHTFSFPAYYGEKPITISGEVTYSLTKQTDPLTIFIKKKRCDLINAVFDLTINIVILRTIFLLGTAILLGVIIKLKRQNRKIHKVLLFGFFISLLVCILIFNL